MKKYTIYAGEKFFGFVDDPVSISFECDPSNANAAYDVIVKNAVLNSSQDLIDFQNCTNDDVKTMLKDLVHMDFLSGFDEKEADD